MNENKEISEEEGKEFARNIKALFIKPVSAKNNSGIYGLFDLIVKEFIGKISTRKIFKPSNKYCNY